MLNYVHHAMSLPIPSSLKCGSVADVGMSAAAAAGANVLQGLMSYDNVKAV